ncbi:MAG TPA: hypothetical protein VHP11_11935, partial [Tepidisphaeraceae bacterium]|nr:hypothetical protein [Tepidisphaeraceae bacterium]
MLSREASDRLAFYASVAVHALLLSTLLRQEAAVSVYLPALPMSRAGSERVGLAMQNLLRRPVSDREDDPRWSRFGEPDGKGYAINTSTGEDLLYGREGEQDQAWLSRDPVGPGPMPEEPSPSTALPGEGGTGGPRGGGGRPGRPGLPPTEESQAATPFGVASNPNSSRNAPRIAINRPPQIVGIIPPAPRPQPIGIGPATTQPVAQAIPATRPSQPLVVVAVP